MHQLIQADIRRRLARSVADAILDEVLDVGETTLPLVLDDRQSLGHLSTDLHRAGEGPIATALFLTLAIQDGGAPAFWEAYAGLILDGHVNPNYNLAFQCVAAAPPLPGSGPFEAGRWCPTSSELIHMVNRLYTSFGLANRILSPNDGPFLNVLASDILGYLSELEPDFLEFQYEMLIQRANEILGHTDRLTHLWSRYRFHVQPVPAAYAARYEDVLAVGLRSELYPQPPAVSNPYKGGFTCSN